MRTIKFRGKRVDNGEWVYGDYHRRAGGAHCIIAMEPDEQGKVVYIVHQVNPATVGQFTGYVENGDDIYEGDVIKVIHSFTLAFGCNRKRKIRGAYDLEWQKDDFGQDGVTYFRNYQIELGKRDYWIGRNGSVQRPLRNLSGFIIGNIHDNPELLKP